MKTGQVLRCPPPPQSGQFLTEKRTVVTKSGGAVTLGKSRQGRKTTRRLGCNMLKSLPVDTAEREETLS